MLDRRAVHEIAGTYKKVKDFDKTLELSQYVVDRWPGADYAVWCRMEVAWVNIHRGNEAAAQAAVDKLSTDYASDANLPWAVCIIAEFHQHQLNYEQAGSWYGWVVEHYPGSPWEEKAKLGLARVNVLSLIKSGRQSRASAELSKIQSDFDGNPDMGGTLRAIAEQYKWQERYGEAETVLRKLEGEDSEEVASEADMELRKNAILVLVRAGKGEEAEAAIEQFRSEFAGSEKLPEALYWIARRYEWSDDWEQAKILYDEIMERYADTEFAGLAMADIAKGEILVCLGFGGDPAVLTFVDEIVKKHGNDGYLVEAAARLQAELDTRAGSDSEETIVAAWEEIIGQMLSSSAFAPWAYHVAGDARRRLGELEKAIANYRQVLEYGSGYEYGWRGGFTIARCYIDLGQISSAISCYEEVRGIWQSPEAGAACLEGIVKCYEQLSEKGQMSLAEADYEIEKAYKELVGAYPEYRRINEVLLKLGWLSFQKSKWQDGIGYFERALAKFPDDSRPSDALYALGRMYEKVGQKSQATATYSELLRLLRDGSAEAEKVKVRIASLEDAGQE